MSDKLPQPRHDEEVDLGQLFNAIGRLFNKLFLFFGKIFKGLFSIIIYGLKPIVNNFKLVATILVLSAVLGFFAEKFNEPVYVSDMLVRPFYDSKYQLANNVNYFNALIGSGNIIKLATVFDIDTVAAKDLLGFEIEIGPETQNDLLKEYAGFIKSIDSALAAVVTYKQFIDNRDILEGTVFSIKVRSKSNDIFPRLEKGFIKTLKNEYSKKLKEKTDSIYLVEKTTYETQIRRIEEIQNIYLEIKSKESLENREEISVSGLLPLTQEKSETKEYELFQEELKIRRDLRLLEGKIIEESQYYDILSGFEEVGSIEGRIYKKYSLLFPLIALSCMILIFFSFKAFNFIKTYD
jgi:hypothetical protein